MSTALTQGYLLGQIEAFAIEGVCQYAEAYGEGHINDTFLAVFLRADGSRRRYIVQRLNSRVFPKPWEVMENIVGVTQYLENVIRNRGGDPDRETLTLVPTKKGEMFHVDSQGRYWRTYLFVENTVSYQISETAELFAESASAFGAFQMQLAGYPAEKLHETIPCFHHTPTRLAQLRQAVNNSMGNRLSKVEREIAFVGKREDFCRVLTDLLQAGKLPLRVTHNDTKLNNVLLDADTGKGICVIDLDTVMPGLVSYDFGDSIRFGASTAAEDEPNLDKVHFDFSLYEAYTKAYLASAGHVLTEAERYHLPTGAVMMTLECGMRFLTDYLSGDVYFKTHRPGQNLDRARTQFRLVEEMERSFAKMRELAMG